MTENSSAPRPGRVGGAKDGSNEAQPTISQALSLDAWSVLAAASFPVGRRAYYLAMAEAAELELFGRELEELERHARRLLAAWNWARRLGLAAEDAELVGSALSDSDRETRVEAVEALSRRLLARTANLRMLPSRSVDGAVLWA